MLKPIDVEATPNRSSCVCVCTHMCMCVVHYALLLDAIISPQIHNMYSGNVCKQHQNPCQNKNNIQKNHKIVMRRVMRRDVHV